jgi:hypothetical protein
MSKVHILLMTLINMGKEVMLFPPFSLAFMIDHRFSIGFKSGEFPGQFMTEKG